MKSKLVIMLLVILVIILGSIAYLFSSKKIVAPSKFENEIIRVEDVSDSTDIDDIEKDLQDTDLDNLDAELSDIESELN